MTQPINEPRYIDALLTDFERDITTFKETRPLHSIFLGGGTPSLFSGQAINRLLSALQELVDFEPKIEITLEANPSSSEAAKFRDFKEAGINRISLGLQSFNDEALDRLGRVHSARQSHEAIESLHAAGFKRFNLDLMFGLPQQSLSDALYDLQQAIHYTPPHLSVYQLTYEPNTLFYHQRPARADDDTLWEMQSQLQQLLSDQGYQQYEVSAYGHVGDRSRHNLNYWEFGDYLGIGAGAHGKVTQRDGSVCRYWKRKHPKHYDQGFNEEFYGGKTRIAVNDLLFEALLNGLRLIDGIPLETLLTRTSASIDPLPTAIEALIDQNLLCQQGGRLKATPNGYRHLDTLLADLLPE